jgi:glyoxylase-like metal-dependent hydrolase (beta-lactamase superfamily II)
VNFAPFAHWISGVGKVETLPNDKDVFGDGSVIILNTPGHTPGHHGLLVKLKEKGNVLITGDLVHFHENYDTNGVPWFNTSRAESLASIDRFKKLAAGSPMWGQSRCRATTSSTRRKPGSSWSSAT